MAGEELLTLTNKHSVCEATNSGFNWGKFFYSTNSSQKDDKYLSYITPIKPNKITDILNKNYFSAMVIETIGFNGKELPISISTIAPGFLQPGHWRALVKTRNISKIFIIDLDFKLRPCFRPFLKPCSKPCYRPWFKPKFKAIDNICTQYHKHSRRCNKSLNTFNL